MASHFTLSARVPLAPESDQAHRADVTRQIGGFIAQLSEVIVGKTDRVKLAVACFLARGHLLIEDIPGVGKTTLSQTLALSLGLACQRIQFTSDRIKLLYHVFCAKIARLGVSRDLSEGPLTFSRRAANLLPAKSDEILRISHDYISLRYSPAKDSHLLRQFAVGATMFGRAGKL